jgi:phosphate transport system protein
VDDLFSEPDDVARELRRSYHDRIAELRDKTVSIVRDAAVAAEDATATLLHTGSSSEKVQAIEELDASGRIVEIEAEVLALLALQAPVASDLRLILASRDIAQVGELCLGLCSTLARRTASARDLLSPRQRTLVEEIGARTTALLRQANEAWAGLDVERAGDLIDCAAHSRNLQREFYIDLVELHELPVEVAVDLGMALRVYERLTDHAVEIASRVVFAVNGTPPTEAIIRPGE